MTLQQCKDQVARDKHDATFKQAYTFVNLHELAELMDESMKLYATEKVKEALRLAAERATCEDVSWDAMPEYEVNKQSILSLEAELIEQINKEI